MTGVRDAGRGHHGLLVAWNDVMRRAEPAGGSGLSERQADCARVPPCRGAGESLESAALRNEAYLKLVRAGGIRCRNRAHFLALCAQMMRRILVDHARRALCQARRTALHVTLDEAVQTAKSRGVELLAWMRRSMRSPGSTAASSGRRAALLRRLEIEERRRSWAFRRTP